MSVATNSSKVTGLWRELVIDNPMVIEVNRFRRRYFEGGRGKSVNITLLVLAVIAYSALLLVIATMSGDFPPIGLIFLQTGVFCILAPALTFGAIAGEREKRSWDLLIVAPISHAQIIAGKFIAAASGIAAAFLLFLIPTMFTALTYKGEFSGGQDATVISGTYALIGEEIISVTFALMLAAATLLFSARCKRALMALGIVLGALFIGLIALPSLYGAMTAGSDMADLANVTHPFLAITRIEEFRSANLNDSYDFHILGVYWYGLFQGFLYLLGTGLFLGWAIKTVTFADGDKRFLPRKHNA